MLLQTRTGLLPLNKNVTQVLMYLSKKKGVFPISCEETIKRR